MTRAPGPETRLDFSTFGASGATRLVVLLREEGGSAVDPDPHLTAHHDVRVLAIMLLRDEVADPGAFGGETPGSTTVVALEALVAENLSSGTTTIGLVGLRGAGEEAILLADRLGERVDRLALVAVPVQDSPLERHLAEKVMSSVGAATLIVNGEKDPDAAAAAAAWHHDHLPDSRVEIIAASEYGPDRRLSISDVWDRVLTHTAPAGSGAP